MINVPPPKNEVARLQKLKSYEILDTPPEQVYDDITFMASVICKTPIAFVSFADEHRHWLKSKIGLNIDQTPRDVTFCEHTILEPGQLLVVPDALKDERFHDSPMVLGYPHVRFYAGAVICTPEGEGLGTLVVVDNRPRRINDVQVRALMALSRQVMAHLELRRANQNLGEYRKCKKQELLKTVLTLKD